MSSAPPRVRPPRASRSSSAKAARTASLRGWLTLLVLVLIVAVVSIGPGTLRELLAGLIYRRPAAASIAPAVSHTDAALQSRLQSVGAALPQGQLSAAVIDLQSGATAGIDADRTDSAASLFKLPIMLEVLSEEDAGQLDPGRELTIRQDDWTDGSGVLQARVGDELPVQELMRLMIQESDNIAALVLLDVTGVDRVNALSARLGLMQTHLVDHRAGEPGDHTTSAADMARLLQSLATGQAVNQRVSEQALSLLELKQSVNWLGDDLPFWVKVAHKWGDLPDARNDAGIVFTPRGSYVIAVLTENGLADEAAKAIARASRLTYDYLGSAH